MALSLAYALLAERMDYGTLSRRRLDLWVFAAGLFCLTAMIGGGAYVEQENVVARRLTPGPADWAPAVVERRSAVSLYPSVRGAAPIHAEALGAETAAPPVDMPIAGQPAAPGEAADEIVPYVALRRGRPSTALTDEDDGQTAIEPTAVSVPEVFTPSLGIIVPEPSAPAVVPAIVSPTATRPAQRPTDAPIEPRLPTPIPSPWASSTPVCGDPRDIDLDLDVIDASIGRGGGKLTVTYRAQVHNRSTFPVRLRDIVVTLEGRDSGTERFGFDRRPDVLVEPSVVLALEGTLALDKSPSPFGTTQFCVSLASETCGRSLPYHSTKRCISARGF